MVTKLDRQLCHVFVSFFGLDRCDNTMIKHMPCLVALSTHWAMKGNSTWNRSLYSIFI